MLTIELHPGITKHINIWNFTLYHQWTRVHLYTWTHFRLPGRRQGTPPCVLEVFKFSSREFFGIEHSLFYLTVIVCLWQSKACHGREECCAYVHLSILVRVPWLIAV
jgi:hypothetical protein